MDPRLEHRLLQLAVFVAACVPVSAGFWGVMGGVATRNLTGESHARYLSGLLLGIGLAYWACVPVIARCGAVFRTLTAIVVLGGLARLAGGFMATGFSPVVAGPLGMELAVTPLLALWRERVARVRP